MRGHLGTLGFSLAIAGLLAGPSSGQQLATQDPAEVPSVTVLGSWQAEGILGK